ncbi:MAG: hypothetical protein IPP83_07170 [Flavobacteriales bacterium]|nr:hypothetical protein [Flavobacteriales bacterium]
MAPVNNTLVDGRWLWLLCGVKDNVMSTCPTTTPLITTIASGRSHGEQGTPNVLRKVADVDIRSGIPAFRHGGVLRHAFVDP